MPAYLTLAELLATGPRRLAEAATPDDAPLLGADILRLAIAGEDLTAYAYDAAVVSAAAEAVSHITAAIERAEGELEAAARERYALPLAPLDAGTLGMLRDMALAYAHRHQRPQTIQDALEAAERRLAKIAAGSLVLPAARPAATVDTPSSPDYSTPAAGVFDDALRGY